MTVALVITVLCGVGLYASLFMLRKGIRAQRGGLDEPSVVQTARARLFGGIPNAAIGIGYYPILTLGIWLGGATWTHVALALAALAAAATSAYLAYSLLFVTKMACIYCWTSHAVNWLVAVLTIFHAIHPGA